MDTRAYVIAGTALVAGAGALLCRRFLAPASNAEVNRAITIGRSARELYDAWPKLLAQTMEPFADVVSGDAGQAAWRFRAPLRTGTVQTETVEAQPPAFMSWRAAAARPGFTGSVRFAAAPRDQGTEVALRIGLPYPTAVIGPPLVVALRRFKSLVETGELPSLERNPSGRAGA